MTRAELLSPELRRRLQDVRSVGVVSGAGISAESGVPTYRGKGGIYDDPEQGDRTVEALSGATLRRDPDRSWRVIGELARRARAARPNPGHLALVEIERRAERFVLLTQNVDGLHQRAGSRNVIDIHGNTFMTVCTGCGGRSELERLDTLDAAPSCGCCHKPLRPDVVLFGEMLPFDKLQRIRRELIDDAPDLMLVVGTSALFPYIVEPVWVARQLGRLTLEVNPEPTTVTPLVDHVIRALAGEALPPLAEAIPDRSGGS